ncbi:SMP-30/gluconolactonase/LRE family protein [Pacificimonas flava]|uniref:SMP-30/Gluconolactonase/LRE-like region domain-containing protein n=1 Tax=Pacificimonas flava TaxID=1234595 RepID=M2TRJ8_9SPHN|nr:SMP-30/gluconolactonase/LRE family protein [Pacificimonas flava]EMD84396.1 hypothetical protein C725_0326 [Pacificimonas flava]MBB5279732.1 sugar lactone lactonase YvrE [Pacificimonas flava]
MTGAVRKVWNEGAILGEGPVWVAKENALYWVDIKAPALHRLPLDGAERRSWPLPELTGWIVPRRAGGFVIGQASGPALLTLDPFTIEPLGDPHPEQEDSRLNDAVVSADGSIWFGTMDNAEEDAFGGLYRLAPDRRIERVDSGYLVPNGPAISADGTTLFHTHSPERTVYAFDLEGGTLANKRVHIRFEEEWGYPDGMAADAEGGLWITHWDGACVSRFDARGRRDRRIELPVRKPTKPVFAGDALDRMFVTSASVGEPAGSLGGAVFEVDAGVRGAPMHEYSG